MKNFNMVLERKVLLACLNVVIYSLLLWMATPWILNKKEGLTPDNYCVYPGIRIDLELKKQLSRINAEKEKDPIEKYLVPNVRANEVEAEFRVKLTALGFDTKNIQVFVVRKPYWNTAFFYNGNIYVTEDLLQTKGLVTFTTEELVAILFHEYGHYLAEDGAKVCYTTTALFNRELSADKFAKVTTTKAYGPHQQYFERALVKITQFSPSFTNHSEDHPSTISRLEALQTVN